jgi:hypothetical protein
LSWAPGLLDKIQDAHDKIAVATDCDLAVYINAISSNSVKGPAGQAAKAETRVTSSWTIGPGDGVEHNAERIGVHGAIFCEGVAGAVEQSATDPAHNSSFKGLMKECRKLHGNESSAVANKCLGKFLKGVVSQLLSNKKLQHWCGIGAKIKNIVVRSSISLYALTNCWMTAFSCQCETLL